MIILVVEGTFVFFYQLKLRGLGQPRSNYEVLGSCKLLKYV